MLLRIDAVNPCPALSQPIALGVKSLMEHCVSSTIKLLVLYCYRLFAPDALPRMPHSSDVLAYHHRWLGEIAIIQKSFEPLAALRLGIQDGLGTVVLL